MRSHPSFVVFFLLNVKSHVLFRIPFWDFQNLTYFFSNLADLEVRETLFPRHCSRLATTKCIALSTFITMFNQDLSLRR